jgi:predicted kinase
MEDQKKLTVVIGIGLPGSGKTTWLRQFAADTGAAYFCPEDIRERLSGDAGDQSCMDEVWAELYDGVAIALRNGHNVVIDATNYRRYDRLKLIRHCWQYTDDITGLWFVTPAPLCQQRNIARSRMVPAHAMARMEHHLTRWPPSRGEGFTELLLIDTSQ